MLAFLLYKRNKKTRSVRFVSQNAQIWAQTSLFLASLPFLVIPHFSSHLQSRWQFHANRDLNGVKTGNLTRKTCYV